MIRGTQREMIMIKGDKDSVFEWVYFVIRADAMSQSRPKDDMLIEANRILLQNQPSKKRKRTVFWKDVKRRTPAFLIGVLCGALGALSIWVIFS